MRHKFFILLMLISVCFSTVEEADSVFVSSVAMIDNVYETDKYLSFYYNNDKTEVGFELYPVKEYDVVEYTISYDRDGGNKEVVKASINNSKEESVIKREGITLGVCTANGTCVYHDVESDIELVIKLYKNGIEERSLNKNLIY